MSDEAKINELEKKIKELESDVRFLRALEAAGVDNWEGYSEAQQLWEQ